MKRGKEERKVVGSGKLVKDRQEEGKDDARSFASFGGLFWQLLKLSRR